MQDNKALLALLSSYVLCCDLAFWFLWYFWKLEHVCLCHLMAPGTEILFRLINGYQNTIRMEQLVYVSFRIIKGTYHVFTHLRHTSLIQHLFSWKKQFKLCQLYLVEMNGARQPALDSLQLCLHIVRQKGCVFSL